MSEEKNNKNQKLKVKSQEKKYPEIVTGVYVKNVDTGKILFVKSPKWGSLVIPGGHVEFGESLEDTVKRETKEEVGLDVFDVEVLRVVEFIEDKDFSKDRHLISVACLAYTKSKEDEVVMDNREIVEYKWLTAKDVLKLGELNSKTADVVKEYLLDKDKKKKLFSKKECEKCEEYKIGWQRALADYKNLQSETEKRRGEMTSHIKWQFIEDVLPVYENLKLTVKTTDEKQTDNNAWFEGVKYVLKQFESILKKYGVEEMKTIGEKFDEKLHDCVAEEESDEVGIILKEISGGYMMNGKVIVPAKVVVSKVL